MHKIDLESSHRQRLYSIIREDKDILQMFEKQGVEGRAVEIVRARMAMHDRIHRDLYYDSALDTSDPPDEFGAPSSDTRRKEEA